MRDALRRLRHRVAHWLGWNQGISECWWDGPVLWVGFRCNGCGKYQHVEPTGTLDVYHFH